MIITKRDGSTDKFQPAKIRTWIQWATQNMIDQIDMEYYILKETLRRLPEKVTTEEIHQTIIKVCLDKQDLKYSEVASLLERASIYKNLESNGFLHPQTSNFSELLDFFIEAGVWDGEWLDDIEQQDLDTLNNLYIELEAVPSAYATIKQWQDKYSKRINGLPVETPAMGAIGIALALHGVTALAFDVARDIIHCRLNLPTPALNGLRDGTTDSVSCCVIEGGDSVESIEVANLLASQYTAKKAGIGIMLNTRSKGDSVKKGAVKHLGKAPLYKAVEASVKKFTQLTRGGSATVSFRCNDPDIMSMLLWKTQRIDLAQRIDKVDYSFVYNDAFVKAVLRRDDWYLFSINDAPWLHDNFHVENYESLVTTALRKGIKHIKVKALDVLEEFLKSRVETGRIYCLNATRVNEHTPFLDPIVQSNLCQEINLPTKPFKSVEELFHNDASGEVAFCSLAALNVSNIPLEEYASVAERALRTVDRMLELAPGLYPCNEHSMKQRRSIGIGITGLASFLYQQGLDYDSSYESLLAVEQLAALHYWSLLSASQKMSKETGVEVQGVDLDWLPIDTAKLQTNTTDWEYDLDWECSRGKPRMHSVLVAHMPTESSALMSNATNGLYPSRARVVQKKARTGVVQFISEHFDSNKTKCWDTEMHKYYAAVQNFTDQGISCDYYLDFSQFPDMKVPMHTLIKWFIDQWAAGNKSCYYHVFKDTKDQEEVCADGCKL